MRAALVLGMVLFVSPIQINAEWAQEPSSYRGVQFGATRATAMAALGNLNVCTVETGNGILACTDARSSFRLGEVPIKERLFFPNDLFVQVTLEFSSDHYAFVSSVFVEKFGKAHQTLKEPFQTKSGSTFENEVMMWEGEGVIVMIKRLSGDVEHARANISTKAFIEAEARRAENNRKQAAASF